jgi:hypothetical protein
MTNVSIPGQTIDVGRRLRARGAENEPGNTRAAESRAEVHLPIRPLDTACLGTTGLMRAHRQVR